MKNSTVRVRGLEGLRMLALTGVLLYHMFPRQIKGGYFGVIIFFVISGFLSAYTYKEDLSLLKHYGKRILRIYPPMIIMIMITVEAIALTDHYRLSMVQDEFCSILFSVNNYWQMIKQADYFANLASTSAFTHLWYISILVQFEVLWGLFMKLIRRDRVRIRILSLLLVVLVLIMPIRSLFGATTTQLYYGTDTRIHALIAGALAGLSARRAVRRRRMLYPGICAIFGIEFLIFTLILFLFVPGTMKAVYLFIMPFYALLCAVFVYFCTVHGRGPGALYELRPWNFFSKYSYEIYLWQYPVLFVFTLRNWTGSLKFYALQAVVILVLSMWAHRFVADLTSLGKKPQKKSLTTELSKTTSSAK